MPLTLSVLFEPKTARGTPDLSIHYQRANGFATSHSQAITGLRPLSNTAVKVAIDKPPQVAYWGLPS